MRCEIEQLALTLSIMSSDAAREEWGIATRHQMQKAQVRVVEQGDDLRTLEWDETRWLFLAVLMMACGNPCVIDLQRKLFNQGRRFRLALSREGRLDFEARCGVQRRLVDAVLKSNTEVATAFLLEDIKSELRVDC